MIKKETILSVFDKKLTLLEYLKEIKKGLEDSAIESFSCDQVDETHVKFALNFADGTAYETDAIEVPTGPQGETGATPQIEVSASAETLAPNESATASVTQGGTAEAPTIAIAFGIPKGDKGDGAALYIHNIFMNSNNQHIVVYSSDLTPFTSATLAKLLYDGGFTTKTRALRFAAGNDLELSGSTRLIMQHGLFSANGTSLRRCYYHLDIVAGTGYDAVTLNETAQSSITDVVTEL